MKHLDNSRFFQLKNVLFSDSNTCQQVVYIARNPKDMCVSYYYYCTLVHNMKGSFEDFCELFLKGRGKKASRNSS
jgi:hypothetical protein